MYKINAIGDACPLPVIKTKKSLVDYETVEVTVDNEIATQNLKKMADQKGYDYQMTQLTPKEYQVVMSRGASPLEVVKEEEVSTTNLSSNYTVVIDSAVMGRGNDQLGATLMKGFLYALTEQELLPSRVIMYNGGVQFAVEASDSCEDLKKLAEAGVDIYACGACTDFYGLTEEIAVGEITNMYRIIEMMAEASRIVKP